MDPQERRLAILEEIRRWRGEGVLDPDTARFLEARYEDPASAGAAPLAAPQGVPPRAGFAANALQFVGGLLLGAALVALVLFLNLGSDGGAWALLLLGGVCVGLGLVMHAYAPERGGIGESLLSAGLIPVGLAGPFAFDTTDPQVTLLVGLFAAALAVGVHVLRRGQGPSVIVAGAAFTAGSFAAADFEVLFAEATLMPRLLWLAALVLYLLLLLVWRHEAWSTVGLGLFVIPLAISFMLVLDALGVDDAQTMEILVGIWLGLLLLTGILLTNRGLVAGAAAGLTIDTLVFSFDLGGPGTAVVVLLLLGGLLVWQAEFLRAWFGGRARAGR